MIDRSEVVVHLVLGDEGRYVVDAVLRFLFHVLADHIIHRFLSDAGQVGHLRGVVEQSSIGVGDFALLRCGEFVLFCAVSSYLLAAMYLLVQNPIGSDLATPTRERKGLDVDPASIQP